MVTASTEEREVVAWFGARVPAEWTSLRPPTVSVDREEIVVRLLLPSASPDSGHAGSDQEHPPETPSDAERAAGDQGLIARWRSETREARMAIAREAQHRFGRNVSWGAQAGDQSMLFTHLAVPVMTRLRQPQRIVLDTLVESGVARSRADAVAWCVSLVDRHSQEWLAELRSAMDQVREVRERGPEG